MRVRCRAFGLSSQPKHKKFLATLYKAFISYSHTGDAQLAPALQSALRRIGKPWYRPAPFRIFLDKSSLAANPALWDSIETALGQSEYFLLLASTSSAQSQWVERELEWWLAHRQTATILILVTEGDVEWRPGDPDFDWDRTTALSRRFQGRFPEEPLWVDLRWARTERKFSLREARWRDSVLQIAPPLYGKSREDLDDEDVRHYRSARRMAVFAALLLAILLAGITFATRTARQQGNIANCRALAAQASSYLDTQLDLALLLGVESSRQSSCLEGRSVLLAALQHRPYLAGFLSGHTDAVTNIAYRPDGRILASSSWDRSVRLWDIQKRQLFGPALKGMYGLSFSPNGKLLASADGKSVKLWSIPEGNQARELRFNTRYVMDRVSFSPDGKVLATSNDPTGVTPSEIFLWDVATGQSLGGTIRGRTFAFSPDGKALAANGSDGGSVVLYDIGTRRQLGPPLEGRPSRMRTMAFSGDGKMLAAGSEDSVVTLWDLGEPQLAGRALTGHRAPVNAVAFNPDSTMLASGSGDGNVILWDTKKSHPIGSPLTVSERPVFDVAFSPDGRTLLSTSESRIVVWDLAKALPILHKLDMKEEATSGLIFSPDGKTLASLDNYGQVILSNAETGEILQDSIGNRVTSVAFDPAGKLFATVTWNGHFALWNRATGDQIGEDEETHFRLFSVTFSPDGRTIAVGGDSVLLMWDTKARRWKTEVKGLQKDRISGVAFSPNGKLLASAGNASFGLWDAKSGSAVIPPVVTDTHPDYLLHADIAFSPDGKLLAYRQGSAGVVLWDVGNRRQAGRTLSGQNGIVSSIAFAPDGKLLATGSSHGSVMLWDVETHQPVGPPFVGMGSEVQGLAFRPDGQSLAALVSKRLFILDMSETSWRKTACQLANRNLTPDEWNRIFGSAVRYRETCTVSASANAQ